MQRTKNLTPNKLLTTLPILLEQIKAGNSNKLKNETRQTLYLLYQHNKITKKVYNKVIIIIEENMIVIKDSKMFCLNADFPKDADDNLKHEFIIKSNKSLAENKIKNKIDQLLIKYKHGNNIHKHRKQQNE